MFRRYWKYFISFVKNKYLLAIGLFVIWLVFFDDNSLVNRYKLVNEVNQFQKDKLYYQKRIQSDSARLNELMTSPQNLEKFAREQYLMKKDNEDIFIIVEK